MSKLKSLLFHIKQGTLLHRLKNQKLVQKHKEWERFENQKEAYLDIETFGGSVLRLYKDFGSSRKIYAYDSEKEEVGWIYRLLKQGDVFIDIGAHIGYFTVTAAAKVGEGGEVHSFEPTPRTFKKLEENVAINKFRHVRCNNLGLSDSEGTLTLNTHPQNEAYNTVGQINAEGVISFEIKTLPLDAYCESHNLTDRVSVIKIDVEGWETPVFSGASKLLSSKSAPLILLEFSYANQLAAGSSCQELAEMLTSFGYSLYTFHSGKNQFEPFVLTPNYRESYNLFAIKDLEAAKKRVQR